jgi:hypothetical protein
VASVARIDKVTSGFLGKIYRICNMFGYIFLSRMVEMVFFEKRKDEAIQTDYYNLSEYQAMAVFCYKQQKNTHKQIYYSFSHFDTANLVC